VPLRLLDGDCDAQLNIMGFNSTMYQSDCLGKSNGDVCVVGCADGYSIIGKAKVLACKGGTFMSVTSVEAAMPICTPKLCNYGYPNEAGVAHDCNQTGLGIVTGKTCLAYCATGYELEASVVDDYTFMCLAYGMLNGTQPKLQVEVVQLACSGCFI
jgi:hypothetical protein